MGNVLTRTAGQFVCIFVILGIMFAMTACGNGIRPEHTLDAGEVQIPIQIPIQNPNPPARPALPTLPQEYPVITQPENTMKITAVRPDHGPTAGGITVSIIGIGFTPDTRVFFGKNECLYPFFIAPTVFNCTTPPHPPGSVDIRMKNSQDNATLHNGFTYESPVELTSCSPNRGRTQGGEPLTIRGSGFDDTCLFMLGDRIITDVQIKDDGHAYGLTPPGLPGVVDLNIICERGNAELDGAFTYFDPGTLPNSETFQIIAIDPAQGPVKGGTKVTIFGKNLVPGIDIRFGGIPAAESRVVSDTIIKTVTPPGSPGPVDVTASMDKAESRLRNAFTYLLGKLKILSVDPTSASIAGNGLIEVVGTDFTPDLQVFFGTHKAMETQFFDANHIFARAPMVEKPEKTTVSVVGPMKIAAFDRPFNLFNPMRPPGGAYGPPINRTINLSVLTNGREPVPKAVVIVNNIAIKTNQQGLVTLSEHGIKGPVTATATMDGYSASTYAGINATNITLAISPKPDPDIKPPDPVTPTYCIFKGRIRDFDKYGINQAGQTGHRLVVCSTSYTGLYGSNPDPGIGAIPDDDGNFQITTRSGKLAVVCTLSINRGHGFVAERMGISQGHICSKKTPVVDGVVLGLDIPLNHSIFLRTSDLPLSKLGTKGPIIRFRFRLGDDGYVDFNTKVNQLFSNITELPGQPQCLSCLNGQGYTFDIYAHEATPNGMPYTRVMAKGLMPPDTTQALIARPERTRILNLPWRVTATGAVRDFMVAAGSTGMVAMGTPDSLELGPIQVDSDINTVFVAGNCDFFMGLKNGRVMHCDCSDCQEMPRLDDGPVNRLVKTDSQVHILSDGRLMTLINGKYNQVGTDFTSLTAGKGWYAVGGMDGRIMQDSGNGLVNIVTMDGPVLGICGQDQGVSAAVTQNSLWINDRNIEIPTSNRVLGVICPAQGPIVFGDQGMALQYTDNGFHDIAPAGLHTAFTTGCVMDDTVFLSGITYMETAPLLGFPEITTPTEGMNDWDGQTIAWMPIKNPRPSFCQVLLSQPGVWTFWVILTGGDNSIIQLPNLKSIADYDLIPSGAKAMNVTCGLKSTFDFNNFSRYDTGLWNLSAYSVNMSHFQ